MASKQKGFRATTRLDDELGEKYERVKVLTGYSDTQILTECLKAYCDHALKYGGMIHPVEVFPQDISTHKAYIKAVEEDKAAYSARRKLKRSVIKENIGIITNK